MTDKLVVHGTSVSGNCHKLRLVLDHLGRPYEWNEVDIFSGAARQAGFRARNPAGQVPVLELADGRCLAESGAILLYLGEGSDLLPREGWDRFQVLRWLFFEQNQHEPYVAVARFIRRFLPPDHERRLELPRLQAKGRQALAVMAGRLEESGYLVDGRLTLADLALYPYTRHAGEAGLEVAEFPPVAGWLERLEARDGLYAMPDHDK